MSQLRVVIPGLAEPVWGVLVLLMGRPLRAILVLGQVQLHRRISTGRGRWVMSANGSETAHEDVAAQGGTATALASFKDWSNYLLVTTVAAAGWVGSGKVTFSDDLYQSLALWCLGTSIVFGIFTLALIPLLAEQIGDESSIYLVPVEFHAVNVTMRMYLTQVCRPQHITFIAGIAFYCVGVSRQLGPVVWVLAAAALLCIFSRPFARLGR